MMSKFLQTVAVLAVLAGFLSACSTNSDTPDPSTDIDTDTTSTQAGSVENSNVEVEEAMPSTDGLPTTFYFEFDSAVLNAEARAALIAHAEYLRESMSSVRLEGHADERGSREYNMALGERRAIAVADFLAVQGVSRSQLETISYGEERPAEIGGSEFSWSKNRRVELSY